MLGRDPRAVPRLSKLVAEGGHRREHARSALTRIFRCNPPITNTKSRGLIPITWGVFTHAPRIHFSGMLSGNSTRGNAGCRVQVRQVCIGSEIEEDNLAFPLLSQSPPIPPCTRISSTINRQSPSSPFNRPRTLPRSAHLDELRAVRAQHRSSVEIFWPMFSSTKRQAKPAPSTPPVCARAPGSHPDRTSLKSLRVSNRALSP